jgi:hypothetical protein
MKTFALTTKGGETINIVKAENIDTALYLFSIAKGLTSKELLKIFNVIEDIR